MAVVTVAALTVLTDAVSSCPHALDHSLDRVLPVVFARQQDAKDAVRIAATRLLQEISARYHLDLVLPGLLRALDTTKMARVKQAVLEYGATAMMTGPSHISARTGHQGTSVNSTLLKQWLRAVTPLLSDKSHDLRRCATEALRAAYLHVDRESVTVYARHSTGAEGMALKRILSELEGDVMGHGHAMVDALAITANGCRAAGQLGAATPGSHATAAGPVLAGVLAGVPSMSSVGHDWSMTSAPGSAGRAGLGPRSYPLDVNGADVYATAASGLQMHCQQGPATAALAMSSHMYSPQGYMSPYKAAELPKLSSSTSQSTTRPNLDVGEALLDEQGAYAVVEPVNRSGQARVLPSGVATTAAVASVAVPADMAGQTRLLHLHIMRLSGPQALEAVQQLEVLCAGKMSASAWLARSPQLISDLSAHVLMNPVADVREAGVRLLVALARDQALVFSSPPPGMMEELMAGLITAATAYQPQMSKCVFEALDSLLDAFPLSKVLSVLMAQLPAPAEPTGRFVCVALQRVMERLGLDEIEALPLDTWMPRLADSAKEGTLEERKAAVFVFAQLKLTLGDHRFARYVTLLDGGLMQLVDWACGKLGDTAAAARDSVHAQRRR